LCTTPACFNTFFINLLSSLLYLKILNYIGLLTFFANNIDRLINPRIPHQWFCTPQLYLRVKYPLQLFICCVHPITQQYKSKTFRCTSVIKVSAVKNTIMLRAPIIVWNWSINCPSPPAMFNSLHSNTNQELFEKRLCNQGSHHEKYRQSQRKPSLATTKSTFFTVSKDEWNTKEDTGKSLKNTLHVLRYALSGWGDVKQWKNQARSFSHYWVMLDWRYQSVSQSVSQEKLPLIFFLNSVATFWKHFGSIWKLIWA